MCLPPWLRGPRFTNRLPEPDLPPELESRFNCSHSRVNVLLRTCQRQPVRSANRLLKRKKSHSESVSKCSDSRRIVEFNRP